DQVEQELRRLEVDFPALTELIRSRFDRPRVVATRLPNELFNLGTIVVDKRAFDYFNINELLGRHAVGDLGLHGSLDPEVEVHPFVVWASPLGSVLERAQLGLERNYGLIQSEYSVDVPGRGMVRYQVTTLVTENSLHARARIDARNRPKPNIDTGGEFGPGR